MTFEQATEKLNLISPNPYIHQGDLFTAIIVPKDSDDRISFISDLRDGKANVSDVKKYSHNDQYNVDGLMTKTFNL